MKDIVPVYSEDYTQGSHGIESPDMSGKETNKAEVIECVLHSAGFMLDRL